MRGIAGRLLAVLVMVGVLVAPSVASAQSTGLLPTAPSDPNALSRVETLDGTPPGHRLVGQQALAIAERSSKVKEALKDHPNAKPEVFLKGPNDWQISWFTPGTGDARKEVAQVKVNDRSATIVEAW
ncbi:MAG TPA: hypothetical protein VNT55_21675, partial [Baekduia sp.]|nr:hypothetical protein [Baekduia sp.]